MLPHPHFDVQSWGLWSGLKKATEGSQAGSLFCLAEESFTLESKHSSTDREGAFLIDPSLAEVTKLLVCTACPALIERLH